MTTSASPESPPATEPESQDQEVASTAPPPEAKANDSSSVVPRYQDLSPISSPTSWRLLVNDCLRIGGLLCFAMLVHRWAVFPQEARWSESRHDLAHLKVSARELKRALENQPNHRDLAARLLEVYAFEQAHHGVLTEKHIKPYLLQIATSRKTWSAHSEAVQAYWSILRGAPQTAIKALKPFIETSHVYPKLTHAYGWALIEQNQYDVGHTFLQAAVEQTPSSPAFLFSLADSAYRQGDANRALQHLKQLLTSYHNPDHLLAKAYAAALVPQTSSNLEIAVRWIHDVETANSPLGPKCSAFLHWARAEVALAAQNYQRAQKEVELAQSKVSFPPFWGTAARIAAGQKTWSAAINAYLQGIEQPPVYADLYWELGHIWSRQKKDTVRPLLKKLRASFPKQANKLQFTLFMATYAFNLRRWNEAQKYYLNARAQGASVEANLGLARTFIQKERAAKRYIQITELQEQLSGSLGAAADQPAPHIFWAELYLSEGNIDSAQSAYKKAEAAINRQDWPVPRRLEFYDNVLRDLGKGLNQPPSSTVDTSAKHWRQRRREFLEEVQKTVTATVQQNPVELREASVFGVGRR